jgi:hypothetical protein
VTPQTARRPKKTASKKTVACDNHPDRVAVLVTDGKAFQVLHLCADCVPPGWDNRDQ